MFPNSSGLFFSLFLFMQREILCHIYPRKVPTLIHLARGKNLRWMPPRSFQDACKMPPDAHQMPAHVCKHQLFGVLCVSHSDHMKSLPSGSHTRNARSINSHGPYNLTPPNTFVRQPCVTDFRQSPGGEDVAFEPRFTPTPS